MPIYRFLQGIIPTFSPTQNPLTQLEKPFLQNWTTPINTISSNGFVWIALYTARFSSIHLCSCNLAWHCLGLCGWRESCMSGRHLRARPGPPFPVDSNVLTYSTKKVFTSFSKASKLRHLFFFPDWLVLLRRFVKHPILCCNSMGTIPPWIHYLWKRAQDLTKTSSKRVLLLQNAIYSAIPLWGCLGLIPGSPVGYQTKIEIYIASAVHGFLVGATQSTCRSLFAQLLPPGSEAEFYSLYEITDKGSAWFGPLVVAAIDNSGVNKLYSMVFLGAQLVVSLWVFSVVDVEKGVDDGREFGKAEREKEGVM
ncbi:vacuole effluxer Atg22 like-domain-containing protein [Obelidium mucronatum]|nr:vacuole effluxer Atg22 like-domain-containing protein [Obelidium mucronatum]